MDRWTGRQMDGQTWKEGESQTDTDRHGKREDRWINGRRDGKTDRQIWKEGGWMDLLLTLQVELAFSAL